MAQCALCRSTVDNNAVICPHCQAVREFEYPWWKNLAGYACLAGFAIFAMKSMLPNASNPMQSMIIGGVLFVVAIGIGIGVRPIGYKWTKKV